MTNTAIMDERRQRHAAFVLDALGPDRADHQVLLVECNRGHGLGAVYATDAGLVFVSHPRPNMLDDRDLEGLQHHRLSEPDHRFTDLLQTTWMDDDLPTGCHCGNHTLSRLDLENAINLGRQLVTIA